MLAFAFIGIWSSGYVVGSVASHAASPLAITFWRVVIAGLVLAGIAVVRRARWPRDGRTVLGIATVGALFLGVQFGGCYVGMSRGMPAGTSALVVSCCPLVVAVVQATSRREVLRARQWLGAALGVVGVVLALLERLAAPGSLTPALWTLLGLAGFAGGTLLMPRLIPSGYDAFAVATVQSAAAAVVLLPWALFAGGLAVPLTHQALGAAAWLTLVNGAAGPLLMVALVRRHGATGASSLLFVVPAVTAVAAWPVLGQPVGLPVVLGLAVSGVGVALLRRSAPRTDSPADVEVAVPSTMGS